MYTYTLPSVVRSDPTNHSERDHQVDTSLPTCVQAQKCRRCSCYQVHRYLLTQTDAHIPSTLHLDKHTGRCFVNAILHCF